MIACSFNLDGLSISTFFFLNILSYWHRFLLAHCPLSRFVATQVSSMTGLRIFSFRFHCWSRSAHLLPNLINRWA